MGLLKKLFGTSSEKELKAIKPIVDKIEALDEEYSKLTDAQLKAKTPEFKERLANGETLDDILPEAFAACREAAWRVLGMQPYRVQLIGGIVLHQGRIAEMKTGEGKTLVATLPAYLNALTGRGRAHRHRQRLPGQARQRVDGQGLPLPGPHRGPGHPRRASPSDRKAAYAADITYGTNNEFGFDYLRDNMAIYKPPRWCSGATPSPSWTRWTPSSSTRPAPPSSSPARGTSPPSSTPSWTPSWPAEGQAGGQRGRPRRRRTPTMDADYIVDEKARTVTLTARGIAKAEQQFNVENLADPENTTLSHHINQAIRARGLMKRDIDYVVKDGEVIIVDEFTGRLMYGRRYSEGLHQAIEAKEHVTVARESKTLATITFQNYFRLYDKLSGMTGTAMTEEEEFGTIYNLDIVEIPTNKPLARVDHPDVVYKTEAGKYRAIIRQIEECHAKGQPVLVGTISIEKSELLSKLLKKKGIKHNVLNAKNHEKEAEIVAQAGKLGAVTVATNMAGRGTDIMLGGNAEYLAKADLRKAGMSDELHRRGHRLRRDRTTRRSSPPGSALPRPRPNTKRRSSREADQVRAAGRPVHPGHRAPRVPPHRQPAARPCRPAGRPGRDPVLPLPGGRHHAPVRLRAGHGHDGDAGRGRGHPHRRRRCSPTPLRTPRSRWSPATSRPGRHVLEYDDVMNTQRKVIYEQRRKVLDGEDLKETIQTMLTTVISNAVHGHMGEQKHMDAEELARGCAPTSAVCSCAPDEFKFTDEELEQYDRRGPGRAARGAGQRGLRRARRRNWASPSCGSWSG